MDLLSFSKREWDFLFHSQHHAQQTKSPSIATLCHICDGFGITLSQFFSDEDESVFFTPEQKAHLALWDSLSEQGKQLANTYIQGLLDMQRVSDINSLEEN